MANKQELELESVIVEVLFDDQIRQLCIPHLENWMFQRTIFSQLIEVLSSDHFKNNPIDMKVLRMQMQSKYKDIYSTDWTLIENLHAMHLPLEAHDISYVTSMITNFAKHRLYLKGSDLFVKGEDKNAEKYFNKAQNFTIMADPFVNPLQEGIIERLKVKDLPVNGKVIRSSLGIINSSLLYKGYKNGDLVMVVMKPKCGKSTFMCQEAAAAAHQGFKVAHMFFGDFTEFDGLCKFMSCVTGDLISNVVNAPEFYKKKCEPELENWRVAAFPAYALDCEEIVSYAKNYKKKFAFDLLVIDYDSNVRPPNDSGMYESGGTMYSTFKGFAQREGSVVIIGSQPKIQFWNSEILDGNCAAESSRKQHVVDIMVTGGRNEKYRSIGTINLPLVRRGESQITHKVKFDDLHSRIQEIAPNEYEKLLRQYIADHGKEHPVGDFTLEGVKFEDKVKE